MSPTLLMLSALVNPIEIVVYELNVDGFSDRQRQLVEVGILTELNKRGGVSAISIADARERGSFHEESGCAPRDCLADLVEAIGSDHLITGRVTRLGETTAIALRVVDLRERAVINSSTRQLTDSHGEGILAAIGPMVEELFGTYPILSGQNAGVSPSLQERWDPKPLSPAVFWTGVAITSATAAIATGFGLRALSKRNDFEDLIEQSSPNSPASGLTVTRAEDEYKDARDLSNIFWVTAGAVAVSTAVVGLMTDWGDDASVGLVPLEKGVSATAGFRF